MRNNLLKFQPAFDQEVAFAEVWQLYPRKRGRVAANREFCRQITTVGECKRFLSAVRNYVAEMAFFATDDQHMLIGSTFFHERWLDYTDDDWTPPKGMIRRSTLRRERTPFEVITDFAVEVKEFVDRIGGPEAEDFESRFESAFPGRLLDDGDGVWAHWQRVAASYGISPTGTPE